MKPDERWREQAACRGRDPDLFHPEPGGVLAIRAAKAVCAGCPVRDPCLTDALDQRENRGVWGGLASSERRVVRRQQKRGAA